jgi:hypothetical protein
MNLKDFPTSTKAMLLSFYSGGMLTMSRISMHINQQQPWKVKKKAKALRYTIPSNLVVTVIHALALFMKFLYSHTQTS